jgi:16S rRNA (cytosine967-C5)-methyltransferase
VYAPDALIVEDGNPLRARSDGDFVAQDEASQLVAALAGARPGSRVLDTCASPGGKTTAMAADMELRGMLIACDVRDRRIALLRKTVANAGAANVRIVQADLSASLPFRGGFDTVFVDVPCSGLGTLRRDPDIRWRRQESDLPALAAAELTMLRNASQVVAPGGRLVYATCSSEPEENEAVADAFLASPSGFRALPARAAVPALAGGSRRCARSSAHRTARPRARSVLRRGLRATWSVGADPRVRPGPTHASAPTCVR